MTLINVRIKNLGNRIIHVIKMRKKSYLIVYYPKRIQNVCINKMRIIPAAGLFKGSFFYLGAPFRSRVGNRAVIRHYRDYGKSFFTVHDLYILGVADYYPCRDFPLGDWLSYF